MSVYEDRAFFGECKWKNEKVDLYVVETLHEQGGLFYYKDKNYIIFSKTGFTKEVTELAREKENLRLVDFASMCDRL